MESENCSLVKIIFEDGCVYGYITPNMIEVYKSIMKGIKFLHVVAIVKIMFYSVNKLFMKKRDYLHTA